ncbi:12985_t:CDS:2 [Gigaspora margarita]|uniref:12985_t:CDS:1 n=1 Tax=Gigaspora margarita TaxID=4874 RepID=A0ABN7UGK0_GIGMA|nr:12985_t:CDS:2 [Gigaspora margarita]
MNINNTKDLNDKENQVIVFKDTHYTSSCFTPDQRQPLVQMKIKITLTTLDVDRN